MGDWYYVKTEDLAKNCGASLIAFYYGNSLCQALSVVYPEYNWQFWKFGKVPGGFWSNESNVKQYLEWLRGELKAKDYSELIGSVTAERILSEGGSYLLTKNGGLKLLLSKTFPDLITTNTPTTRIPSAPIDDNSTDLDTSSLPTEQHLIDNVNSTATTSNNKKNLSLARTTISKTQLLLSKMLQDLFPDTPIHLNYKYPTLRYEKSGVKMEFDIFLPDLNLAFEYQGAQHYSWHFIFGSPDGLQVRDEEKKNVSIYLLLNT